jgi:hypothetical protein
MSACQKYDFSDEAATEETDTWQMPIGTGEGTVARPYTVDDMLTHDHSGEGMCWVIGYVIGATYQNMGNVEYKASTTYKHNVLLAADSFHISQKGVLPVELSTAALQKSFSIPHHPEGFHQCVMFLGKPARYFYTNGLREIRTGHWMYHFDISTIHPHPQEWVRDTISSRALRWRR